MNVKTTLIFVLLASLLLPWLHAAHATQPTPLPTWSATSFNGQPAEISVNAGILTICYRNGQEVISATFTNIATIGDISIVTAEGKTYWLFYDTSRCRVTIPHVAVGYKFLSEL